MSLALIRSFRVLDNREVFFLLRGLRPAGLNKLDLLYDWFIIVVRVSFDGMRIVNIVFFLKHKLSK